MNLIAVFPLEGHLATMWNWTDGRKYSSIVGVEADGTIWLYGSWRGWQPLGDEGQSELSAELARLARPQSPSWVSAGPRPGHGLRPGCG